MGIPNASPIWSPLSRTREIALMLTGWQSETGTGGERQFGPRLAEFLATLPCFRDHPDRIRLVDSHDGTWNVVALLRGSGRRTLAMAGHYDTVPVANYRDLAPLACQPEPLLAALLEDLRSRPLSPQEEKALQDFESGDFLPGRGFARHEIRAGGWHCGSGASVRPAGLFGQPAVCGHT